MSSPTREHAVTGAGRVRLHVEEAGPPAGRPVVLVHGFSQSGLCWRRQLRSPLAEEFRLVAPDLRGHGRSDAPDTGYDDPAAWAGDLTAVVEGLGLARPVLVGWSYGGYVLCDYLRAGGAAAGLVLVAAATDMGSPRANAGLGADFLALARGFFSPEVAVGVPALAALVGMLTARELPAEEAATLLGVAVQVRPQVRRALFSRSLANDDVLAGFPGPALLVHGDRDRVVLPVASEQHAAALRQARTSVYEGVGHMPFWEDPARFNRELADFVRGCG
jgi:non-heme chloroperoxidase